MSNLTPLSEYWDMVNSHDWSYMMSDDHGSYTRGSANESRLKSIAQQSPEHQAIWDGFYKYWWSGPHMNSEKQPKPERPS